MVGERFWLSRAQHVKHNIAVITRNFYLKDFKSQKIRSLYLCSNHYKIIVVWWLGLSRTRQDKGENDIWSVNSPDYQVNHLVFTTVALCQDIPLCYAGHQAVAHLRPAQHYQDTHLCLLSATCTIYYTHLHRY